MASAQPVETRGQRLGQARRLLGVALGRDLSQKDIADMVPVSNTTWNRWEVDDDRPREGAMQKIVDLFIRNGMPYVTPAWIEYGVEAPNFPRIVTDMVEAIPTQPPVEATRVESARTKEGSARPRPKRSGGRGR